MVRKEPRHGGTLRYFGPGSMDHVDPASAYYALSHQIIRLYARQLFNYPTAVDMSALTPVPDVATEVPTVDNGGISADLCTYTIRLRPDVYWDTTPPREVTAADFVRGFKRMCNPVAGAGAIAYYTSTIKGMSEFAAGYRDVLGDAESLSAYQNTHEISGLRAIDDRTLEIELVRPANDLLNILSMTFASAAPVEYDQYVPDSPEFCANIRSNGPYRLTAYEHGRMLTMERNPAWRQDGDPLRHQYVSAIEVKMERVTQNRVRRAMDTGEADLSWASPVIVKDGSRAPDADRHLGYALNPYIVFNLRSPNERGAVGNVLVRRAIAYAVNKAAVVKLFDALDAGTETQPAHTAIPPGNFGYREYDLYPTPGDRGDPQRCRELLAEAGYPDGLTLTALYRNVDVHPEVAKSYTHDLAAGGITVNLVPVSQSDYYRLLQDPDRAVKGEWDFTAAAWTPDWFGNNGRAYIQPMFQSNFAPGTANYGDYSNPEVDRLIKEALAAQDTEYAKELWHRIDRIVLEDVAIVPILVHEPTIPHMTGKRVKNAIPMPHIDRWFDATNLWLDPPD